MSAPVELALSAVEVYVLCAEIDRLLADRERRGRPERQPYTRTLVLMAIREKLPPKPAGRPYKARPMKWPKGLI